MPVRVMCVAAIWLAAASLPAGAETAAPRVSVDSINALSLPDHPYNQSADPGQAVDQALARARQNGKKVLIDLGGNWCADCLILSGVMALPEVQAFLNARYEIVLVDIGRVNRNLAIPARFGVTVKLEGVPAILIVTPDGHLVNKDHFAALAEARNMTPQAIVDWLAQWSR